MNFNFVKLFQFGLILQLMLVGFGLNLVVSQDVTVDFTYDQECETFTFVNQSTPNDGITITGFEWDFGDLSDNSTARNPVHSYTAAGSYYVTLKVNDSNGDVDYITRTLQLSIPETDEPDDTDGLDEGTEINTSEIVTYLGLGVLAGYAIAILLPKLRSKKVINQTAND